MSINSLFYSIHQGLKNILRNKMFSIASVATMGACIFMFGIFYIVVTNFNSMIKEAEEGVAVTVFFEEDLSLEEQQAIGKAIHDQDGVREAVYVSAEEAWERFKDSYFEGDDNLATSFEGDNPLEHSANYEVYLSDVSKQDEIVAYINSMIGVRSVKESEAVANILADFNKLVSWVSISIIAILLLVAVFLISNTVSVGVTVRKDEIAIMKLIGATDFLVRAPFIVEGIAIGAVGALVPLIILKLMYGGICDYIANKFNFIGSMIKFVPSGDIFGVLIPISLALGVGIGFVGSTLTLRKHLQV